MQNAGLKTECTKTVAYINGCQILPITCVISHSCLSMGCLYKTDVKQEISLHGRAVDIVFLRSSMRYRRHRLRFPLLLINPPYYVSLAMYSNCSGISCHGICDVCVFSFPWISSCVFVWFMRYKNNRLLYRFDSLPVDCFASRPIENVSRDSTISIHGLFLLRCVPPSLA